MDKIRFDPTINTGNVLAMIMVLGGLLAFWIKIETSITKYETKIEAMEHSIQEVKEEMIWLRRNYFNVPRQSFEQIPFYYDYTKEHTPCLSDATDYPYCHYPRPERMDTEGIRSQRERRTVERLEKAQEYL